MPTLKLTNEIIAAAIEGFEAQKARIDLQIAEMRELLTGSPSKGGSAASAGEKLPRTGRRKMSAAGRMAIAEAQRKRWAAQKALKTGSAAPEAAAKPKRKLSAAGRKAIIAATKKRWALKRAEAAKA